MSGGTKRIKTTHGTYKLATVLPVEIWCLIINYCEPSDYPNFFRVCKFFHESVAINQIIPRLGMTWVHYNLVPRIIADEIRTKDNHTRHSGQFRGWLKRTGVKPKTDLTVRVGGDDTHSVFSDGLHKFEKVPHVESGILNNYFVESGSSGRLGRTFVWDPKSDHMVTTTRRQQYELTWDSDSICCTITRPPEHKPTNEVFIRGAKSSTHIPQTEGVEFNIQFVGYGHILYGHDYIMDTHIRFYFLCVKDGEYVTKQLTVCATTSGNKPRVLRLFTRPTSEVIIVKLIATPHSPYMGIIIKSPKYDLLVVADLSQPKLTAIPIVSKFSSCLLPLGRRLTMVLDHSDLVWISDRVFRKPIKSSPRIIDFDLVTNTIISDYYSIDCELPDLLNIRVLPSPKENTSTIWFCGPPTRGSMHMKTHLWNYYTHTHKANNTFLGTTRYFLYQNIGRYTMVSFPSDDIVGVWRKRQIKFWDHISQRYFDLLPNFKIYNGQHTEIRRPTFLYNLMIFSKHCVYYRLKEEATGKPKVTTKLIKGADPTYLVLPKCYQNIFPVPKLE